VSYGTVREGNAGHQQSSPSGLEVRTCRGVGTELSVGPDTFCDMK
jgi:hypothetical protein